MSRIQARENVFKLIFEYSFLNEYNEKSLNELMTELKQNEEDCEFLISSYKNIIENYEEIVEIIKDNLQRYTLDRVTKIDLSILVVAVYEIKHCTQGTNYKVAINEAVELAKKYSSDNGYKFINGVLARVVEKISNEN